VAEKQSAKMTYKGFTGYMPIVGHIAENGLVLGDEFREGNMAPAARNLEFIKHCIRQMPTGKRLHPSDLIALPTRLRSSITVKTMALTLP